MKIKNIISSLLLFCVLFASCSDSPKGEAWKIEKALNEEKQEVFDMLHPIGTAKLVKVNSISESGPYVFIRFTLFWEGPITKEGYTKVLLTYDSELDRLTETEIEDTNGLTNENLGYGIGSILGRLLFQ